MRFPEFNDVWSYKKISDLTKVSAGATPRTNVPDFWGGNIKWMNSGELNLKHIYDVDGRITELGYKNASTKLLPKECVLIGLAGQGKTRGTAAINHIELCTNQSIAAILPCNELNSFFLYYNIDSRYQELRDLSSGDGGRGGLNLSLIGGLKIPLCSLPEQNKISDFLQSIEKRIETQNKIIEHYESLIKGIREKLFKEIDGVCYCLGDFLTEFCLKNTLNNLEVASVGKYGIRLRNAIYKKELTEDLSKNKVISRNTFVIGMGSAQIDIGILTSDSTYCVSPAYSTFQIKNINSVYLNEYIKYLNPILSKKYMIISARQGKSVNKAELMKHNLIIHNTEDQLIISDLFCIMYLKLEKEKDILSLYLKQKAYLLSNMFI